MKLDAQQKWSSTLGDVIGLTEHFSSCLLQVPFALTFLLHPHVVWALLLPPAILLGGGLQLHGEGVGPLLCCRTGEIVRSLVLWVDGVVRDFTVEYL